MLSRVRSTTALSSPHTTPPSTCCQALSAAFPDRLYLQPLEVTEEDSIDKVAARAAEMFDGKLDFLINTAGVLHTPEGMRPETALSRLEAKNMMYAYQVNAMGPTLMTRACEDMLRKSAAHVRTGGPPPVVANLSARVGSIGDNGLGGWHSYRASKAALNMLTKNVSLEVLLRAHPGMAYLG